MKKLTQKIASISLATVGLFQAVTTQVANASTPVPLLADFEPPTGFSSDIGVLINAVLSFVMVIAALLVFFYLIWGGIEWITSGGDKGKIDSARSKMFAAIIGLLIVASSYAIFMVLLQFLGFKDFADVIRNVNTLSGQPLATGSATLNIEASESAKTATESGQKNLKRLL